MLTQNNPTVDLTVTSKYNHYSVDKDDDEEDDLPTRNLSTTDNEVNDETEDPFEPSKPSPIASAQIETALPSPIDAVPIVAKKPPVFMSTKVPASLSSNSVIIKPSPVSTDYIPPRVEIYGRHFNKAMISEK